MKLLIIEDEKELSESISYYLGRENYICDTAPDYPTALKKVRLNDYTCIILDLTLPGGNGLAILQELKKNKDGAGVIIISAKNSLQDKVTGLKTGADDYLPKPFHLPELSARIDAVMRRKLFAGHNEVVLDKLILNMDDRTVRGARGPINLTRKEYELLLYFVSNKDKVVTKESIVEHLWGDETDMISNYDFIYTHIKNLRKKLTDNACPDYIKAVHGVGYKFSVSSS
jgi:DNA-binding response OmpR family regulator